ncbi:NRDE protein-domain-containing protein [Lasiosphaeria hispida]|uniref:NRDE protein-domain-containing protein n=1 Tax=Lasiosphaeria hispida TaxID=260671 RepID=A0AAJ0HCM8_9PEZI|nr:NRDE protein-domain-containing protein [Lasiosphaeria hispida]
MCIVLLTTSHPKYALIVIDNRDEYILRPTSRPHWWTAQVAPSASSSANPVEVEVLSSRDLQRAEHGTWLGITKGGNFAVLTNYRETDTHDAAHPIHGTRSRGAIVTAWLAADPAEPTESFVRRMLESGDVKGVGGFSLICGKLRRTKGEKGLESLAIISNRHDHWNQVPWICGERGGVYGLSNATYIAPDDEENQAEVWPKIRRGSELLAQAISDGIDEDQLEEVLFKILDRDDFPGHHEMDLEDGIPLLKHSIFVPGFGGKEHQQEMQAARERGQVELVDHGPIAESLSSEGRIDTQPNGFQTGLYGTQRQTIMLVDWDGNVTYKERSLYDSNGNLVPRGSGDMKFKFKVDGWNPEADSGLQSDGLRSE